MRVSLGHVSTGKCTLSLQTLDKNIFKWLLVRESIIKMDKTCTCVTRFFCISFYCSILDELSSFFPLFVKERKKVVNILFDLPYLWYINSFYLEQWLRRSSWTRDAHLAEHVAYLLGHLQIFVIQFVYQSLVRNKSYRLIGTRIGVKNVFPETRALVWYLTIRNRKQ